jgi:hypothetical protein
MSFYDKKYTAFVNRYPAICIFTLVLPLYCILLIYGLNRSHAADLAIIGSEQTKKKMTIIQKTECADLSCNYYANASSLQDLFNRDESVWVNMPQHYHARLQNEGEILNNLDAGEKNDKESIEDDNEEEDTGYTISGLLEFENFMSTEREQELKDANKKNEIRSRLKLKFGTENLYLYTVNNVYINSSLADKDLGKDYYYSDETEISRNLRVSSESGEASFNELYLNFVTEMFRIRIGNQIYGWGTADAFNPTSYFNPYDARELLFKDDDEIRRGVPSASFLLFLGDYTLELVYVPLHIPMILPSPQSFWFVNLGQIPFSVDIEQTDGLGIAPENFGYGARLAGTIRGMDLSLSGYHGPDREAVLVPSRTVLIPNKPIALLVEQQYYIINMIGFDFSVNLDKFVIQCEASYSPDKRGLIEQDDLSGITLPFQVKKSHFIAYAAGFNYFIPLNRILEGHEGETVFTFEWTQSRYLDNEVASPLISDIVTGRIEDSYLNNRIQVSMTGIYGTRDKGYILWPKLGYDFQNGLLIEISYVSIQGNESDDSMFDYSIFNSYSDNDIFMWRIRYEY